MALFLNGIPFACNRINGNHQILFSFSAIYACRPQIWALAASAQQMACSPMPEKLSFEGPSKTWRFRTLQGDSFQSPPLHPHPLLSQARCFCARFHSLRNCAFAQGNYAGRKLSWLWWVLAAQKVLIPKKKRAHRNGASTYQNVQVSSMASDDVICELTSTHMKRFVLYPGWMMPRNQEWSAGFPFFGTKQEQDPHETTSLPQFLMSYFLKKNIKNLYSWGALPGAGRTSPVLLFFLSVPWWQIGSLSLAPCRLSSSCVVMRLSEGQWLRWFWDSRISTPVWRWTKTTRTPGTKTVVQYHYIYIYRTYILHPKPGAANGECKGEPYSYHRLFSGQIHWDVIGYGKAYHFLLKVTSTWWVVENSGRVWQRVS